MNFTHGKDPGKNVIGITFVIGIHVLVAYGIVTGLGTRMVSKMAEAVETRLIEEVAPPPKDPPPPPPPEMKVPPPPFVPLVEVVVQQIAPVTNTISNATNVRPVSTELAKPPAPAPVVAKPVVVAAVADFNSCAKPEWPKASLRNEETGTVTLSFLIGTDGRVADSKVLRSSGFRDLDRAAMLGIGKCQFKPGTIDGKPESTWMQMQYVWTLE